jgi:flagellar assembly factor FliW
MTHQLNNQNTEMTETIFDFINGVPGFPTLKRFYIKDLKDGSYPPLKLMISVDNEGISFILYPHVNGDSLFDEEAILGFARAYDLSTIHAEVYSMVTVRQPNGTVSLTTNLNAPIVLNRSTRKGWQHIVPANDGNLVFPLEALSKTFQSAYKKHV